MQTAAYIRVSSQEQSTDLQQDGLTAYAERAGLTITDWYEDHAVSGRKEGRPALN